MKTLNPKLILRLGGGICFLGHGVLALTAKAKFITLLSTFGIEEVLAIDLLKLIGCMDILVGLLLLFKPTKFVLLWAMIWTGLTIVAWGLHGDSLMDLFRRIPYVTTPFALLVLLYSKKSIKAEPALVDEVESLPSGVGSHKISPLTVVSSNQGEAIDQLDLSMICKKLMDKETGEGWSKRQCAEVAQEYRRYLKLNLLYPEANIVPNMAVDMMWHYHILDTEAYYRDCHSIFGYILHHYPYFGMQGQSDQKQFVSAFDQTKRLYRQTFTVPMEGPEYLPSFRA